LDFGFLVQHEQIADRFGWSERFNGLGGDVSVWYWRTERFKAARRQAVGEQSGSLYPIKPVVFDRVLGVKGQCGGRWPRSG